MVLFAFATVYLVWGSTYLAIRVALETIPPFSMAALRLVTAGAVLLVWLRLRGAPAPTRTHCWHAAVGGILLLTGGNGLVVWAEQTVSSGWVALIVSLVPVWFALIAALLPGGEPPQRRTLVGIAAGFGGMVLLVTGSSSPNHGPAFSVWGVLAVLVAGISWAAGSLYSKHHAHAESPWMTAALQMLFGGAALLVLAGCTGEGRHLNWSAISMRSLTALAYLIAFGSWLGYGAYVWLLKNCKPSHVATYAYVNPVVALLLGHLVLGEALNGRVFLAAAITLAGVVIITLPKEMFLRGMPRGLLSEGGAVRRSD
jgi:drug/metabolite transporter (DMT)-like permease